MPHHHPVRGRICLYSIVFCISFFTSIILTNYTCFAAGGRCPYEILGISKSASQEDIRKNYKVQCLRLHPDKTGHLPLKEREKKEAEFKEVQRANSLIGNEEARRKYDLQEKYGSGKFFNQRGASRSDEDIFRPHANFQFRYPRSNVYPFGAQYFADQAFGISTKQSIYVEVLSIPLCELYTGVPKKEVVFCDSLIERYKAAFRGGCAQQLGVQTFASFVTMLLRTNIITSAIISAAVFHTNLPRLCRRERQFVFELKKGWKGGTKLKFDNIEPGISLIFVLKEENHDRFQRIGDDLHTDAIIGESKARDGCTILIDHLVEDELPIEIQIRRGEIKETEYESYDVNLKGRGWPKKDNSRGDLVVHVKVKPDKEAREHQAKVKARKMKEDGSK